MKQRRSGTPPAAQLTPCGNRFGRHGRSLERVFKYVSRRHPYSPLQKKAHKFDKSPISRHIRAQVLKKSARQPGRYVQHRHDR